MYLQGGPMPNKMGKGQKGEDLLVVHAKQLDLDILWNERAVL